MQPLSRKKRISMLVLLIVIFLLGSPVIIFYSIGYRLDDALSLVKTGGIFIHSNLSGTEVYIDGDFVENNGVILRNTLVQDLRPNRSYEIRVEKKGYNPWTKELFVFPNLVTEGQILMLPSEIKFREITETIPLANISNSTNTSSVGKSVENPEYILIGELFGKNSLEQFEVVVSTTTPTVIRGQIRLVLSTTTEFIFPDYIKELDIDDIEEKKLLREKQRMVSWMEKGLIKVVWANKVESIPFFFCLEKCNDFIDVSFGPEILYYDFLPGRDDILLVLTKDGIFAIEIDNRSNPNIQTILEGQNLEFRVRDNNTIFIKEGKVFKEVLI